MASFNVDLKNLFNAAQKANSKTNISDAEKKILNEKKDVFDINGDGKFDQDDVVLFVEGDIDGDGKVSDDELNFVAKYKDSFAKAMTEKTGKTHKISIDEKTKAVTDTVFDKNNKVAKKTSFNHETQKSSNVTYKDGVKSKQTNIAKDGTKNTYTFDANGKKTSCVGVKTDGTKVTYTYKDGVKTSAVKTDKKGNKIADYTYFTSGENAGKIKTKNEGDNIKTYAYYSDGDVKSVKTENKKTGKTSASAYTYETKTDAKTGEQTKVRKKDGVKDKEIVTSKDGKTVTEYSINSKGQKTSATKNVKGGALTKYEYAEGKVAKAEVYENGDKTGTYKYEYSTKDGVATRTTIKNGVKYQIKDVNLKTGLKITKNYDAKGKNVTKRVLEALDGSSIITTYDSGKATTVKKDKNGKVVEKKTIAKAKTKKTSKKAESKKTTASKNKQADTNTTKNAKNAQVAANKTTKAVTQKTATKKATTQKDKATKNAAAQKAATQKEVNKATAVSKKEQAVVKTEKAASKDVKTENKYDEKGRKTSTIKTDKNGNKISEINYSYEAERKVEFHKDANGKLTKRVAKYNDGNTTEIQYDKWGTSIKKTKTDLSGKQKFYMRDKNNNWQRVSKEVFNK